MSFKPLIIDTGVFKQLPSGQALDAGGWTLPTAGGTEDDALIANGSGNAQWTRLTDEMVDVDVNGSPTYSTVGDFINTIGDSGVLSGMTVSDDFDGTITVSSGTGLIYTTDSDVGSLVFFDLAEDTTVTLTDDVLNYVYAEYNSGSPRYQATTDITNVSGTHEFLVGLVYKEGTTIHAADVGKKISSFPRDSYRHAFVHDGLEHSNGLVTSETGNRYLAITSGQMSLALQFLSMSSFDSSGADTLTLFYHDGSWQEGSPISQLPNTQYNDYGVGLTDLTAQRYGLYWMYMSFNGDVHGVYGVGNYLTLAQAEAATSPANLPNEVIACCLLISKIIFKKSDTNFTEIYIPWISTIGASVATDHGSLAGLGDDDHTQYVLYTGATTNVDLGSQTLTTTGTVVGSNIPAPTVDDQVLISTASGVASWSTAGNNQILGSDGSGEAAWENKSFGYDIPANSAVNEIYVGTGAGTAAWTTDLAGITSLTVDNITINGAVISSDTGAISFSDEDLTTAGTLYSTNATGGIFQAARTGGLADGYIVGSFEFYTYDPSTDGEGICAATRYECDGTWNGGVNEGHLGFYTQAQASPVSTLVERMTIDNLGDVRIVGGDLILTAGSLTVGNITIDGNTIDSDNGSIILNDNIYVVGRSEAQSSTGGIFRAKRLDTGLADGEMVGSFEFYTNDASTDAAGICGAMRYECDGTWNGGVNIGYLGFYTQAQASPVSTLVERMTIDNLGDVTIVGGDLTLTAGDLAVGNITISGASVTSNTGAISFNDEDLTTSGTVVGTNIPSPTTSGKALVSTAADTAAWYTTSLYDALKIEVPSASGAERKFVLTADPGSQFEIESAPWPLTLTANETIYIRTTGNDSTGDGSAGFPFLTVTKAIQYIGQLYIGDYYVTVDIGEGVFTEAATLTFQHPFGSQVNFTGVSEQITSQDTNSISASGTYLGYNQLYRYDVTFILPVGKSVSVGDYIGVTAVSGGTLPEALYGMHYVSGWVGGSRTATVQVVYRNNAPKASGTVTCTIDLVKTVIAFSNKNGLKIVGPNYGGNWGGLVFQGDWDGANNAKYGVWCLNTGMCALAGGAGSGFATGVVGFQTGLYTQNNALIFSDYCYVSKMGSRCANAQNGGILNLRYAKLSGTLNNGIFAFNGSTVAALNVKVVAMGDNAVVSYQGSFIDAQGAYVDQNYATNALVADRWSGIDANGSSYSDSISPSTPGNNDGSYVIIT